MPTPRLIVVTGRPGSGKTTLAHALAREIRCPAICRDEIKEGVINTTEDAKAPDDDIPRRVYDAFFDVVKLLLERNVTLVAEAAFQHKLWAPKLEPLRSIADVRIVVCSIDPQLARARRDAREFADAERARFHPAWTDDEYDPPRFDVPTLTVNTSAGYLPELPAITEFARQSK